MPPTAGDGLPLAPLTRLRWQAAWQASGLSPETVLGEVAGQVVRAEAVVEAALRAGCPPAACPVVLAAVRAMLQPAFALPALLQSPWPWAPLLIVHGPVARRLGFVAGAGVLGPGPGPNAAAGRALTLWLRRAWGRRWRAPVLGTPAAFGLCLAEAEDRLPVGWWPLHVERGVPAGRGAVTVVASEGPVGLATVQPADGLAVLSGLLEVLRTTHYAGGTYVVVLAPPHAQALAAHGLAKRDLRAYLAENACRTLWDLKETARLGGDPRPEDTAALRCVVRRAEDILVVVAGGDEAGYSVVVPAWAGGAVSQAVTVPLD